MHIALLFVVVSIGGINCQYGSPDTSFHKSWKYLRHDICGHSASFRIIGGKNASMGAYPWIARIGYVTAKEPNPDFRCGAVVLNSRTALTAAHCVSNLPRDYKVGVVRVGEHYTQTDPDCEDDVCAEPVQDMKPSEIIIHENYDKPIYKNDIAMIRFDRDINFTLFAVITATFGCIPAYSQNQKPYLRSQTLSDKDSLNTNKCITSHYRGRVGQVLPAGHGRTYVRPICLLNGTLLDKNYTGSTCEVAGWGIYDINNPKPSDTLLTIKLAVVDNEKCGEAFSKYADIDETQLCVGGNLGQDSCGGDSGGPLMKIEDSDNPPRYYLLGIVSFGAKKCGFGRMPGVYTRISAFMPWILDNLVTSTSRFKRIHP